MARPEKLFHATPTKDVETILRDGLKGVEFVQYREGGQVRGTDPVNLSTEDETSLVAFFGESNGCIGEDGEPACTITLLEVDVRGIPMSWPGQDGDHHYEVHEVIPPERIRVVRESTLDEVASGHAGAPLTPDNVPELFDSMDKSHAAWENRRTV